MKKLGALILCVLMVAATVLTGCKKPEGGTIEITFWSAPSETQFDLWTARAEAFNAANVTYQGKTVVVTVEMIPESDSSESAIQNALATDSAPAASENISASFNAVLASSGALYDIQDEAWFKEVCARKQISDDVLNTWAYEGKQYVLPEYINCVCWWWNLKALNFLGFDKTPTTYAEYEAVIAAFAANRDALKAATGCEFVMSRNTLSNPAKWWHRNYDFLPLYYSFGGQPLTTGNKLNVNDHAFELVMEFYGLQGDAFTFNSIDNDYSKILCDGGIPNPSKMEKAGLVYGVDYVYTNPIVEKAGDTPHCYADTKGIVFYKDSNISEEQHGAAETFIAWVYNEDNCSNSDVEFFKATGQMPVRGDILTNTAFADWNKNEFWQYIAGEIGNAIQGSTHADNAVILGSLVDDGMVPYLTETMKKPVGTATDASSYVKTVKDAMIKDANLDK